MLYVAQIDDDRLRQAMGQEKYLDVTTEVLAKYNGVGFADESFVVQRTSGDLRADWGGPGAAGSFQA